MAGTPQDKARPAPEQGRDDGTEVLAGDPTGNPAVIGADPGALLAGLNEVPQDVPVADLDAVEGPEGQEPAADREDGASVAPPPDVLVARGRTRRYSEGHMRLRVSYPDDGTEMPSALVIRSKSDAILWILLMASAFCALMAWAANGPPPDGDVASARFLAIIALGLLGVAWRYASTGRLRATKQGIVITGFASRRRVRWADLLDVTVHTVTDPEMPERRYEEIYFETKERGTPRSGDPVRVIKLDGLHGEAHDPTGFLHFVSAVLLAMRYQYAVIPQARADIQDS